MQSGKIVGGLVILASFCASILLGILGVSLMLETAGNQSKAPRGTEVVIVLPSQTPLPPTATPLPTETPIPLPTSTPIPLPTNTPTPLPTNTPLPLPTNTPQPLPTSTDSLPTNTIVPPTATPDPILQEWEEIIRDRLDARAPLVNIQSVEIADGRAAGGEVVLIISFLAPESRQLADIGSLWGASYSAMNDYDMEIDSLILVYAVSRDSNATIAAVAVSDLYAYFNDEITIEELLSRVR